MLCLIISIFDVFLSSGVLFLFVDSVGTLLLGCHLGWPWAVHLAYFVLGKSEAQCSLHPGSSNALKTESQHQSSAFLGTFPLSLSLWPLNTPYSLAISLIHVRQYFLYFHQGIFSCVRWEGQPGHTL